MTPFVQDFAKIIDRAIDQSAEMAIHITRKNTFFREASGKLNDNQTVVLKELFERGPERTAEGISNRYYNRTAHVSRATASRDLADLAEKGLVAVEGAGPTTVYKINATSNTMSQTKVKQPQKANLSVLRLAAEAISNETRREQALNVISKMENVSGENISDKEEDFE